MPTVNVKTFQGQVYPIETELSITVADLKKKIETATGSASDTLRVICSGRVLSNDAATLESADVKDGATLHIVAISASAAPAPAATPAAPQSLFSGAAPSSSSSSGGTPGSGGGGGGGGPPNAQMMQMLTSPQGRNLVRGILQNPQVLQQLANDPQMGALLRNPEFQRALSDPSVMQQVLGSDAGGGGGGGVDFGGMDFVQRPYPSIPRDIFDDGMAVLNGGALPQRYADAAREHEADRRAAGGGGGGGGSGEWTEVFTRASVNSACDAAFGPPPVAQGSSGPAATPAAAAAAATPASATPAAAASTAASATPAPAAAAAGNHVTALNPPDDVDDESPAPVADGAMDSTADDPIVAAGDTPAADSSMEVEAGSVSDGQPPPPAASPIAAAAPPPAAAAAAPAPAASAATPEALGQLVAMGFANEALNRQALEAANGDVGMALTFLMGGP
eukprot:gene19840-25303_t